MLTIPKRILQAPLMRQGGYAVVPGLFAPEAIASLRCEADVQRSQAQDVCVRRSDAEPIRGGDPARKFLNAPGGAVQLALYGNLVLRQTVASIVGLPIVPTGSGGTFTYYCRPLDFLTIHRDIVTCDVALITCLAETGVRGSGGKLCLYPQRIWEDLGSLRREPIRGAVPVRLAPGETAILLGGIVPHCTLPVSGGQCRVVSLLCYRVLSSQSEV
jgi:hypothetical protein